MHSQFTFASSRIIKLNENMKNIANTVPRCSSRASTHFSLIHDFCFCNNFIQTPRWRSRWDSVHDIYALGPSPISGTTNCAVLSTHKMNSEPNVQIYQCRIPAGRATAQWCRFYRNPITIFEELFMFCHSIKYWRLVFFRWIYLVLKTGERGGIWFWIWLKKGFCMVPKTCFLRLCHFYSNNFESSSLTLSSLPFQFSFFGLQLVHHFFFREIKIKRTSASNTNKKHGKPESKD